MNFPLRGSDGFEDRGGSPFHMSAGLDLLKCIQRVVFEVALPSIEVSLRLDILPLDRMRRVKVEVCCMAWAW